MDIKIGTFAIHLFYNLVPQDFVFYQLFHYLCGFPIAELNSVF